MIFYCDIANVPIHQFCGEIWIMLQKITKWEKKWIGWFYVNM